MSHCIFEFCLYGKPFQKDFYDYLYVGFWQKIDTYEEQPDIHFEHEMIVQLETADPDKTLSWSTMNNYNALLGNRIRSSNVQVIQFYK